MRRTLLLAAAAAVIAILTAVVLTAAAQSVRWTGYSYIVVDETATGPAAVVGRHEAWSDLVPIYAFEPQEFAGIEVRQRFLGTTQLAPDNRYELLAVANRRGGTYVVTGFENENAPVFEPTASRVPGIGTPYDVAATDAGFMIVAGKPGEGPDLTNDYRIAYQDADKWEVVPGPDFRGGVFVDLAVSRHGANVEQLDQIVAVGTSGGGTVYLTGLVVDGEPVFEAVAPQELPYLARPISVEWTGSYFVVMGLDWNDHVSFVYGRPGAWSESKMQLGHDVTVTGFAAAPIYNVWKPAKHYDLLAVGRVEDETVTLAGEEYLGLFPTLVEKWAVIPGFGRLTFEPPMATVAAAPLITASPNPFSDRSTLTLSVDREQPVLVEVFDAIGRRVTVLHNAVVAAGTPHTFTFDAAGLPGGVYHFRVSGVDFDESRQVTLVR